MTGSAVRERRPLLGQELLGIINDILDFSKIEADKLELESSPFSLREVLEEVTETFRSVVIQKHVELITHALPSVPDRLLGDPPASTGAPVSAS